MSGDPTRPIVIAAGGTGGHTIPAEALATELARRSRRIVLMADARSSSMNSAVFRGRERFRIMGAGIAGRGVLRGAKAIASLAAGAVQARAVLAEIDPDVVVAFGGYPSVAPVLATRLLSRRPLVVLHEQNAVLGRANRFLARYADRLALSFPQTARLPDGAQTVVTGNPVRPAFVAKPYLPPGEHEPIRVLVLGGSLGARVLSEMVPSALTRLPAAIRARLHVTQQCRAEDLPRVRGTYTAAAIPADTETFFADVPERMEAAHIVIARAGASTIAELSAMGRPSVLVPLPGAIDDHQRANARYLGDAGGAWVIDQRELTADVLSQKLAELLGDSGQLSRAAAAAAASGKRDAAARLADVVFDLIAARGSAPAPGRRSAAAMPWGSPRTSLPGSL